MIPTTRTPQPRKDAGDAASTNYTLKPPAAPDPLLNADTPLYTLGQLSPGNTESTHNNNANTIIVEIDSDSDEDNNAAVLYKETKPETQLEFLNVKVKQEKLDEALVTSVTQSTLTNDPPFSENMDTIMMTPDSTPQSKDVHMDDASSNKRKYKAPLNMGKNQTKDIDTQNPPHKNNTSSSNTEPAISNTDNTGQLKDHFTEDASEGSIDRSEGSYEGPWIQATNGCKTNNAGATAAKTDQASQAALPVNPKTSFKETLPTHKSIGGKKIVRKLQTRKTLTAVEVAEKCGREPTGLSDGVLGKPKDETKLVYFLHFELCTTTEMTHTSLIQVLFDRILIHDKDALIKPYFKTSPGTNIDRDTPISTQCYTKANFKNYFTDFWTTETKDQQIGERYSIHGKLRFETRMDWPDLKGRMEGWLKDNKYYVRKPYLQTERVLKLGVLLGSSTAQWRQDTQKVIEEAVHAKTGVYIHMDVQKRTEKFTTLRNTQDKTPILSIQAPAELADKAIDGLQLVFAQGLLSPVGRRMIFIPTRDRSAKAKAKFDKVMIRQKELNVRERQTATDALQDISKTVKTTEGTVLTIQQIICDLTDKSQKRIFTGAERMGTTGKILFTYDVGSSNTEHEVVRNIVPTLESLISPEYHQYIANESKRASRETLERRRLAHHDYMEEILAEWFDYTGSKATSVSTISRSDASLSSESEVSLDSSWTNPTSSSLNPTHQTYAAATASDTTSANSNNTKVQAWN